MECQGNLGAGDECPVRCAQIGEGVVAGLKGIAVRLVCLDPTGRRAARQRPVRHVRTVRRVAYHGVEQGIRHPGPQTSGDSRYQGGATSPVRTSR